MKHTREIQPRQRKIGLKVAICFLLFVGGVDLSAQDLFEVPSYELSAEQIRNNANTWNLTPQKVKSVFDLDVSSYYGRSSDEERKQQQKEELRELKKRYLDQFYYIDQEPRAHVYDESEQYSHEQHGITIYHKGLNFIVIPKKTVDLVEGLLTTRVQSLVNLTPRFEAFEANRENHRIMLLFKLDPDALALYYDNKELRIRSLRVIIYNKYSEEVVYDHDFSNS